MPCDDRPHYLQCQRPLKHKHKNSANLNEERRAPQEAEIEDASPHYCICGSVKGSCTEQEKFRLSKMVCPQPPALGLSLATALQQ